MTHRLFETGSYKKFGIVVRMRVQKPGHYPLAFGVYAARSSSIDRLRRNRIDTTISNQDVRPLWCTALPIKDPTVLKNQHSQTVALKKRSLFIYSPPKTAS